ncbi:hypothetical protein JDN40_14400 [Rhodomicrobium vannielii ATCC 17100]|uniref:hypothetical protein n=1 Tax=Rhodomicrobium vannielii TaxID=1069 RepID=UPI00191907C8|nr:hypothetical protein [Rhodomicrobium vannielii]MBJ7535299.1 hypothetical protein [Rhodomicrobium vannielii ATCC 17100]
MKIKDLEEVSALATARSRIEREARCFLGDGVELIVIAHGGDGQQGRLSEDGQLSSTHLAVDLIFSPLREHITRYFDVQIEQIGRRLHELGVEL